MGMYNEFYSQTIAYTTTGFENPSSVMYMSEVPSSVTGIPAGLNVYPAAQYNTDGSQQFTISGTPTDPGIFNVNVKVTNGAQVADVSFQLTISGL